MAADWIIKAGDLAPAYEDTLTFEDGSVPSFTGATLEFVMRSGTSPAPVTLNGTVTIVDAATGAVRFDPAAGDTVAGRYMALWRLTDANGRTMSFPTVGYVSVVVEDNPVTASAAQLVSLPDAKDYLGVGDRYNDSDILRAITALRPVIENITGPIIPTTFTEHHDGGNPTVQIRRRPSSGFGTAPILDLVTVTEDWGATTYNLAVVASASLGSTYSCMIDEIGTVSRLTGGGGRVAFAGGTGNVHVTYQAGQTSIPVNVRDAALELLRVNFQTTMAAGRGRFTVADDQETGPPLGFFIPRRVTELLSPNRRAPSIA